MDENLHCVNLLKKRLVDAVPPNWEPDRWRKIGIDIEVRKGKCEPTLEQLLDEHRAWGHPILAVLDTWGGGVSARLMKRFAENKASEVIITIQPQHFARFAKVQDIEHGDRVFGTKAWREVANQSSSAKISWLRSRYRQTVEDCGFNYVLDFELADEAGHILYLVFGTNHKRGLQKMKEAMWEVDDVYGTGYRDPRDPDQETLQITIEPQTEPLKRLLLVHLASLPAQQATLSDLRAFALFRTVYKESQARQVVIDLLRSGKLTRVGGNGAIRPDTVLRLP